MGKIIIFGAVRRSRTCGKRRNFVVMEVRGDLQAIDLKELHGSLKKGDVLFEGNPFIGCTLLTHPKLNKVNRLSVFVSPLSRQELSFLKEQSGIDLESLVTDVMRRKLLRRMQRQKGLLSQKDLEEVERRATSAFRELTLAHQFEHVIANHDGEDSENWNAFYAWGCGENIQHFRPTAERRQSCWN